jgi:hypothetical protein
MTKILTNPPGWLVKAEDHEGDPLARYIRVRISDPDTALLTVAEQVAEKQVHLERNLVESEVADMEPGEVSPQ